mmetsp:Transcript_71744/g.181006  ORF Transcript_71744/g.181006 Transcript_71744/m.181006 type:complete len:273 (-) Transcript_71744:602-1420(-)
MVPSELAVAVEWREWWSPVQLLVSVSSVPNSFAAVCVVAAATTPAVAAPASRGPAAEDLAAGWARAASQETTKRLSLGSPLVPSLGSAPSSSSAGVASAPIRKDKPPMCLALNVRYDQKVTQITVVTYMPPETTAISCSRTSPSGPALRSGKKKPKAVMRPQLTSGGSNDAANVTPLKALVMPLLYPRAMVMPEKVAIAVVVPQVAEHGGPLANTSLLLTLKTLKMPFPSWILLAKPSGSFNKLKTVPIKRPMLKANAAPKNIFRKPRLTRV